MAPTARSASQHRSGEPANLAVRRTALPFPALSAGILQGGGDLRARAGGTCGEAHSGGDVVTAPGLVDEDFRCNADAAANCRLRTFSRQLIPFGDVSGIYPQTIHIRLQIGDRNLTAAPHQIAGAARLGRNSCRSDAVGPATVG